DVCEAVRAWIGNNVREQSSDIDAVYMDAVALKRGKVPGPLVVEGDRSGIQGGLIPLSVGRVTQQGNIQPDKVISTFPVQGVYESCNVVGRGDRACAVENVVGSAPEGIQGGGRRITQMGGREDRDLIRDA